LHQGSRRGAWDEHRRRIADGWSLAAAEWNRPEHIPMKPATGVAGDVQRPLRRHFRREVAHRLVARLVTKLSGDKERAGLHVRGQPENHTDDEVAFEDHQRLFRSALPELSWFREHDLGHLHASRRVELQLHGDKGRIAGSVGVDVEALGETYLDRGVDVGAGHGAFGFENRRHFCLGRGALRQGDGSKRHEKCADDRHPFHYFTSFNGITPAKLVENGSPENLVGGRS
jgi:hypothetical protein